VRLSNISAPFWQSAVSYRRASGPRPQRVVKPAVIATWAGLRILHITACSWCRAGITFTWRRGRKIVAMGSNMDAKIPPSPAANEFVFSRSILPPKSTAADFFSRQEHANAASRCAGRAPTSHPTIDRTQVYPQSAVDILALVAVDPLAKFASGCNRVHGIPGQFPATRVDGMA
jgi:hypothetical protein